LRPSTRLPSTLLVATSRLPLRLPSPLTSTVVAIRVRKQAARTVAAAAIVRAPPSRAFSSKGKAVQNRNFLFCLCFAPARRLSDTATPQRSRVQCASARVAPPNGRSTLVTITRATLTSATAPRCACRAVVTFLIRKKRKKRKKEKNDESENAPQLKRPCNQKEGLVLRHRDPREYCPPLISWTSHIFLHASRRFGKTQ
jgi:hypothetical protein